MKRFFIFILCIMLCLIAGCTPGKANTSPGSGTGTSTDVPPDLPAWAPDPQADPPPANPPWEREPQEAARPLSELTEKTIRATITMEDGGVIVAELYPDLAPQTVRNFVYLARLEFYNGLKFHRIMNGFMIQGGCPKGDGTGNPGYSIWGEFEKNGFKNELKHEPGVLSMARADDPNSAGSQFFIMHGTSKDLDGAYAAFGVVTEGMDVVERLAKTPNSGSNGKVAPENMPVIKSIVINDDIELPEPEKIPR